MPPFRTLLYASHNNAAGLEISSPLTGDAQGAQN